MGSVKVEFVGSIDSGDGTRIVQVPDAPLYMVLDPEDGSAKLGGKGFVKTTIEYNASTNSHRKVIPLQPVDYEDYTMWFGISNREEWKNLPEVCDHSDLETLSY